MYLYLFLACVVLEVVTVPFFLKACWPKKTTKSLVLKMICSSLFVLMGLFAVLHTDNHSSYAQHILIGLTLCWVGDFLLHVKPDLARFFIAGISTFFIGHVFYISAFVQAIQTQFPYVTIWSWKDILPLFIIVAIFAILIAYKKKFPKPYVFAVIPYAVVLMLMVSKAMLLGSALVQSGAENANVIFLLLSAGPIAFLISDTLLGMIYFLKQKGFSIKVVNIVTYYFAQLTLAATLFFIT